jgi:hypothetical protein
MPLPNRVDPFGRLFADTSRGLFFGNRGGHFHRDDRTLGLRRWVSRCWICCFLDEPTALAAGHRPCFECRRADAKAFAAAFARGRRSGAALRAREMDRVLHAERLDGRAKRRHRLSIDELPDGTFLTLADEPGRAFAVRGESLLQWTSTGYSTRRPRPHAIVVDVLTPPAIVAALASGYRPHWHPSANEQV